MSRVALRRGDVILLCSDGLHGPVSDEEIVTILNGEPDLKKAADALLQRALEHDGPDNITCVLARVDGAGLPEPTAEDRISFVPYDPGRDPLPESIARKAGGATASGPDHPCGSDPHREPPLGEVRAGGRRRQWLARPARGGRRGGSDPCAAVGPQQGRARRGSAPGPRRRRRGRRLRGPASRPFRHRAVFPGPAGGRGRRHLRAQVRALAGHPHRRSRAGAMRGVFT